MKMGINVQVMRWVKVWLRVRNSFHTFEEHPATEGTCQWHSFPKIGLGFVFLKYLDDWVLHRQMGAC